MIHQRVFGPTVSGTTGNENYLLYITYLYILKILQSMSHGKTKTHLANCWNSECDGFGHGKQPMALETSACLYAAPDSSTYFLIISWTQIYASMKYEFSLEHITLISYIKCKNYAWFIILTNRYYNKRGFIGCHNV